MPPRCAQEVRAALLAAIQLVRSVRGFTHLEVPLHRLYSLLTFFLYVILIPFVFLYIHLHTYFLFSFVKFLLFLPQQFSVLWTQNWYFSNTLPYSIHQHWRLHLIMRTEVRLRCCCYTEGTAHHRITIQRLRPACKFRSSSQLYNISYVCFRVLNLFVIV